ncbi:MAG: hypothetical protein ACRDOK_00480 [Streptosporangiaceae bacterium]
MRRIPGHLPEDRVSVVTSRQVKGDGGSAELDVLDLSEKLRPDEVDSGQHGATNGRPDQVWGVDKDLDQGAWAI